MAFDRGAARLHLASSALEHDSAEHSLVIRTQPVDEWYKDQGGRKALLSTTVASPFPLTSVVPLSCRLLLESGTPPADGASLLHIEDLPKTDMLALGPEARQLTIKFRILKVSRNFDNSRFVLEISPDYSQAAVQPSEEQKLSSVRTFPILVKSKRRRPLPRRGDSPAASEAAPLPVSSFAEAEPAPAHAAASSSAAAPAGADVRSMLAAIMQEQRRVAQALETLSANQAGIMGMFAHGQQPRKRPHEAWAGEAGEIGGVPPTPPCRTSFRREGTDSSIDSLSSDVTLQSVAPDLCASMGRPHYAVAPGAPHHAPRAVRALHHGPPRLSPGHPASVQPSAGARIAAPMVLPGPGYGGHPGGVDQLLAAALATDPSAKRARM